MSLSSAYGVLIILIINLKLVVKSDFRANFAKTTIFLTRIPNIKSTTYNFNNIIAELVSVMKIELTGSITLIAVAEQSHA